MTTITLRIAAAAAFLSALACGTAQAANISGEDWGTTQAGEKVSLFTLKGAHGLEARITNYGGRIVSLMCPTRRAARPMSSWATTISRLTRRTAILWRAGGPLCRAASAMAAASPWTARPISWKRPTPTPRSSFMAAPPVSSARCGQARNA